MALRIVKASDPVEVKQLALLIFGQPGIGKTSAGFTAEAPLLLDFDAGAYRSAFRQDSVPVESWEEVAALSPADLKPYKTIVVDTGGRALDKITAHIVSTQPKLARASGALTLQGYGELKAIFTGWVKQLRELGKDIVILAHDAEDKNGDDLIVRPDFQGGSRQEVIKVADAIGYMYQAGKRKVLDFNPTDRWIGKNCAALDPVPVPDFATSPHFLAELIAQMKETLNRATEAQKQAAAELSNWQEKIDAAASVDDFNNLIQDTQDAHESVRNNVKLLLISVAKAKGFPFDMKAKRFVAPEPEEPTPEQMAGAM